MVEVDDQTSLTQEFVKEQLRKIGNHLGAAAAEIQKAAIAIKLCSCD